MIDQSPSARVPGYTGHQPGIVAESLIGRSYAYITGFRADLLKKDSSTKPISEYKRGVSEGTRFEPSKVTQAVDASIVPRPLNAPDAQTVWKSKTQYNDTLNLSADGRMPGYTGHVPHFKFQGSIGLPFAKACQKGDHLRPPDGSHNTYEHVNPHHKQGRHIDKAVSGYSGFMSYVKTLDAAMTQKQNAGVSLQLEDLNKTNAHYTPSMLQVGIQFYFLFYASPYDTATDKGLIFYRVLLLGERFCIILTLTSFLFSVNFSVVIIICGRDTKGAQT